jgi:hypothetical protein
MKRIRLSKWAELNGYTKRGAYNLFKQGKLPNAIQLSTGTILVNEMIETTVRECNIVYSRVSSPKQKEEEILNKHRSGKDITADIPSEIIKKGRKIKDKMSDYLPIKKIIGVGRGGNIPFVDLGNDEPAQDDFRPTFSNNETFEAGDIVWVIDKTQGKLPADIYKYLTSKPAFEIKKIYKGKIDIGCKIKDQVFYFSPKRFSKEKDFKPEKKAVSDEKWWSKGVGAGQTAKELDPYNEEDWGRRNWGDGQLPPPPANIPEEGAPPLNTFKIIVGDTPDEWGINSPTSAIAVNLINHRYGDAGWAFDDHLSAYYPVLDQIELEEMAEGTFEYSGEWTKEELVAILQNLGFNAEIGDMDQPFPVPV